MPSLGERLARISANNDWTELLRTDETVPELWPVGCWEGMPEGDDREVMRARVERGWLLYDMWEEENPPRFPWHYRGVVYMWLRTGKVIRLGDRDSEYESERMSETGPWFALIDLDNQAHLITPMVLQDWIAGTVQMSDPTLWISAIRKIASVWLEDHRKDARK